MTAKLTCAVTLAFGALVGSCLPSSGESGDQASAEVTEADANPVLPPDAPLEIAITQFSPSYFGKWGMVPADCESGRADAKGLISVQGSLVKFYESTATLRDGKRLTTNKMQGNFEFAGEGEKWERPMRFELSHDRRTLTRTELADGSSYRYRKCET